MKIVATVDEYFFKIVSVSIKENSNLEKAQQIFYKNTNQFVNRNNMYSNVKHMQETQISLPRFVLFISSFLNHVTLTDSVCLRKRETKWTIKAKVATGAFQHN